MAALNNANNDALRDAISSDNWSKHEHVQWIVDMAQSMTADLIDTIRDQFDMRTLAALRTQFESNRRKFEREENLRDEARSNVEELLEGISTFVFEVERDALINANSVLKKTDKDKVNTIVTNLRKIIEDIEEEMTNIENQNKEKYKVYENGVEIGTQVGPNFAEIQKACDSDYIENWGDSISTFDLDEIEDWHKKRDECLLKMIHVMQKTTSSYNNLYELKNPMVDTQIDMYYGLTKGYTHDPPFEELIKALIGSLPGDENKNILTGVVTALVGKSPADSSTNILTGMKV